MPTNCKDDMWTEITNICSLRSQNATSLKVQAGIKQACRQVLRFKGQNNLLGGKICFITVYV